MYFDWFIGFSISSLMRNIFGACWHGITVLSMDLMAHPGSPSLATVKIICGMWIFFNHWLLGPLDDDVENCLLLSEQNGHYTVCRGYEGRRTNITNNAILKLKLCRDIWRYSIAPIGKLAKPRRNCRTHTKHPALLCCCCATQQCQAEAQETFRIFTGYFDFLNTLKYDANIKSFRSVD